MKLLDANAYQPNSINDIIFGSDEGKTRIDEIVEGRNIGSSKKCIEPNDILLSKIVPHIRRCCVVPPKGKYRQIASGEWIQFRSDQLYSQYLKFFLISDTFHWQFMHTVSGVGGSLIVMARV